MNLEAIIFGILCLGLILSLTYYLKARQRDKKLQQLQNYLNLAEKQELKITQFDFWDTYYAIGVDIKKKKLLYIQNEEGDNQETIIDLSRAKKCWMDITSRDSNGNKIIETISLIITGHDSKDHEKSLMFYNKERSFLLNEELNLAKKWEGIINTAIQGAPTANLRMS